MSNGSTRAGLPGGLRSRRDALWLMVASGTLTVMAGAILGPVVNEIRTGSPSRRRWPG